MKKITLKFDNSLTRLAGNTFGQEIYNTQVKDEINFDEKVIIVFPENIKDLAISFVQGFISDILLNIDISEFNAYFKIEGTEKVINKFKKSIYY